MGTSTQRAERACRRKENLGPVFHQLAERFTKRGVVVILSDFFDDIRTMIAGLKHFAYRRHDVALLHVLDPAELEFPFAGPTEFEGLEDYPELQADASSLHVEYLREFSRYQQELRTQCRGLGMEYRLLRTDQPLDVVLASWLSERMARTR